MLVSIDKQRTMAYFRISIRGCRRREGEIWKRGWATSTKISFCPQNDKSGCILMQFFLNRQKTPTVTRNLGTRILRLSRETKLTKIVQKLSQNCQKITVRLGGGRTIASLQIRHWQINSPQIGVNTQHCSPRCVACSVIISVVNTKTTFRNYASWIDYVLRRRQQCRQPRQETGNRSLSSDEEKETLNYNF